MGNNVLIKRAAMFAAAVTLFGYAYAQSSPPTVNSAGKSLPHPAQTAPVTGVDQMLSDSEKQTIDEITRIGTENALLKAKLKQLELQVQIATANAQLDKARGEQSSHSLRMTHETPPVVQAIDGIGNKLFADIRMPDGRITEVKAGDVLSDGTRILEVKPESVLFRLTDKRTERVPLDRSLQKASKTSSGSDPLEPDMYGMSNQAFMSSIPQIPLTQRKARK